MKRILTLAASIAIPFLAGGIGSLATVSNIPTWYADLDKPFLNPPNGIFGPVWSTLYLLIGISLYLVWTDPTRKDKRTAYVAFATQIVLNTVWSLTFFGLHAPWLGLGIILALIAAIIWNIMAFHRISKTAAYLLIPYLLWVCFATYLNAGIAWLN